MKTAEEIAAKQFGWDKFAAGPLLCETNDFIAAMNEYATQERNKAIDEAIELINKNYSYFTRTTNETNLQPEVIKALESLKVKQ